MAVLILLVLALVCFVMSAFNVPAAQPGWPNLTVLGLAFLTASMIVPMFTR